MNGADSGFGVDHLPFGVYSLDGAFVPYTAPVVVDTVGAHMLHYRATDVAGNTSQPSAGFSITIDALAPAAPQITSFPPLPRITLWPAGS